MNKEKYAREKFLRRAKRKRAKIKGLLRSRICVYRSSQHIGAQIIDDIKRQTIACAYDYELKDGAKSLNKSDLAREVGKLLARKAIDKGVGKTVFDVGGYAYHGRVKALADGLRQGGLQF